MAVYVKLDDGTEIPVDKDYALQFQRMSPAEQKAEGRRLKAAQAGSGDTGTSAAATPPAGTPLTETGKQPGVIDTGVDVLRSAGAGLRRGVEGIPGTVQDLTNLGGMGLDWLTGRKYDPNNWDIPLVPSSEDIHAATSTILGSSYEPKTTFGKYAETAGEFAPTFFSPTSGLKRGAEKLAAGVGAGLASEAAGQAVEGTKLEPLARVGVGIATGTGLHAAPEIARTATTSGATKLAEEAARDAAAKQHGVELTAGQRSGNLRQQRKEEGMLHGTRGGTAQTWMERRRRANIDALTESADKLKTEVAPSRGADAAGAASELNARVQQRVWRAKREGGAKIEKALTSGQTIDADRLRNLPGEMQAKLTGADPAVPEHVLDDMTPAAKKAMAAIERYADQVKDPAQHPQISLAQAERLRRNIGQLDPANPTDARALSAIREHFDDWLEGGVQDPAVLAELKAGRARSKEGLQVERPNKDTPGGAAVAKIASAKKALPESTASMFRPLDRGDLSEQAINAVKQLVRTGASGEELDQVRAIILETLTSGPPGKQATRIDNFVKNNPTVVTEGLFTREQLAKLKALGDTSKTQVPNPLATNPSKSGWSILAETPTKFVEKIPVVGPAVKEASGAAAANRALKPFDPTPGKSAVVEGSIRSGVGGGQEGQMTIDDPTDPDYGVSGVVVGEGKDGVTLRMPNGKTRTLGKRLVKPQAP